MKSESSKYTYEVWEDPNLKTARFYIRFTATKKEGSVWGNRWRYVGGYARKYFETEDAAKREIQEQIRLDDPTPHIKCWP